MTYKVGQVIFLVSEEQNKVLPFQIVEEITRKTLNGDEVQYKVVFGVDQSKTKILSELKGEIFTTLDDVKAHLMKNVSAWVLAQLERAKTAAQTWYKIPDPMGFSDAHQEIETISPDSNDDFGNDQNLVELPDGRVVKARIKQVSK